MATTSIWRVKGWLGKVVIYAENPEKTANPKFYTDRELTEQNGQQLSDVIRYAVNSEKTQKTDGENGAPLHCFVSGINCSPSTARDEMLAVKKRFGKEDIKDSKRRVQALVQTGKMTSFCLTNSQLENHSLSDTFWPNTPKLLYGHARNDLFFPEHEEERLLLRNKYFKKYPTGIIRNSHVRQCDQLLHIQHIGRFDHVMLLRAFDRAQ